MTSEPEKTMGLPTAFFALSFAKALRPPRGVTFLCIFSVTVAILAQGTPRGDAFYAALPFLAARVRIPLLAAGAGLFSRHMRHPVYCGMAGLPQRVHTFSAFWL